MPTWILWSAIVVLGFVVGFAVGRIYERERGEACPLSPDELRELDRYLAQLEKEF